MLFIARQNVVELALRDARHEVPKSLPTVRIQLRSASDDVRGIFSTIANCRAVPRTIPDQSEPENRGHGGSAEFTAFSLSPK